MGFAIASPSPQAKRVQLILFNFQVVGYCWVYILGRPVLDYRVGADPVLVVGHRDRVVAVRDPCDRPVDVLRQGVVDVLDRDRVDVRDHHDRAYRDVFHVFFQGAWVLHRPDDYKEPQRKQLDEDGSALILVG